MSREDLGAKKTRKHVDFFFLKKRNNLEKTRKYVPELFQLSSTDVQAWFPKSHRCMVLIVLAEKERLYLIIRFDPVPSCEGYDLLINVVIDNGLLSMGLSWPWIMISISSIIESMGGCEVKINP